MNQSLTPSQKLAQSALNHSNVIAVTGIQWWDEWKWKAVSAFQWEKIDYIIGANGGGNAGHTVVYQWKKLDFHELPGGSIIQWATIYLSKWRVIQLTTLFSELQKLKNVDIDLTDKLVIWWWAQVILKSIHQELDKYIEGLKWVNAVGTTHKWIWPAYALGDLRIGFTIKELYTSPDQQLRDRIKTICWLFPSLDQNAVIDEVQQEKEVLQKLINEWVMKIDYDDMLINTENQVGKMLLIEQSQSFLLGKWGGAYPYCTSSDTSVTGMLSYLNLPYTVQPYVIGTMKAVMSKVGGWLLATKMGRESKYVDFEKGFANLTGEKWVTTGRLRDLGWVDIPALRHVRSTNPFHTLLVTKGDILSLLAQSQQQANLPTEMRIYTQFGENSSGITTNPNLVGHYESITLDVSDTWKNIQAFGEQLRTLVKFSWPIYFGTGPEEKDIVPFHW